MSEEKGSSEEWTWKVPAVRYIPQIVETFGMEEMAAWESVKGSTFQWLYEFEDENDTDAQLTWKKHVAYLRKMLFENVDHALYPIIEAARKQQWVCINAVALVTPNVITIPVPELKIIHEALDEQEFTEEEDESEMQCVVISTE